MSRRCPVGVTVTSVSRRCGRGPLQRAAGHQSTAALTAAQEEFRRYRIRSETLLRQKEDEIAAVSRAKPAGGPDTSLRGVEDMLAAAEARAQKLTRAKAELQEQVCDCVTV